MRSLMHKGITWLDDANPSEKVLQDLQHKYGFHELDIEDCLSEHERPKIEEYDTYLFLVFHIPYLHKKSGRVLKEEVNIFLGQDYIITLHRGRIPILDTLRNQLEDSEDKRKEYLQHGTGYYLYELMNHLFEDLFPLVDSISKKVRVIEDQLFESEEEVDLLREIMSLKRNIITMRSILLPQRTLIATLEHKNKKFVPEELGIYFDDILDAIERQWSVLDTAKEMVDSLQDTHESFLSHKTNAIVRILTIVSVTMLPLTLLSGIYGMNITLPYDAHPFAFLGIAGVMILIFTAMVTYFWRKHWF